MINNDEVLLDACVLIPMPLADTLLRLASGPRLFRPKWSDHIMVEVSRTLQEKFGISPEKTQYREKKLRQHFPEARIEGYENMIPAMSCHSKDRHVLAAAVQASVKLIVTYNLKDFPLSSVAPYSITVQSPSAFLKSLYDVSPTTVIQTLEAQAATICQPVSWLFSKLRINVPAFVDMLEQMPDHS